MIFYCWKESLWLEKPKDSDLSLMKEFGLFFEVDFLFVLRVLLNIDVNPDLIYF